MNTLCRLGLSQPVSVHNMRISLRQWRMLHAVVECGSFSGAAERLHVSQSAISYTISKLQGQLGIEILKIEGRKAHITEQGVALLERSRHLLRDAIELEQFVDTLRHGWQSEIRVWIEPQTPSHFLTHSLRLYLNVESNTRIDLREMSMAEIRTALHEQRVDLAITSQPYINYPCSLLLEVPHVVVVHQQHPLSMLGRPVSAADLSHHINIAPSDQESQCHDAPKQTGPEPHCWYVKSHDIVVGALIEQLGYAWVPCNRIQDFIRAGSLCIVPLQEDVSLHKRHYLIRGRPDIENSAASLLAQIMIQCANANIEPWT